MTKVHTQIYYGKTIDVFRVRNEEWRRYDYITEIDGKPLKVKGSFNYEQYPAYSAYGTIGRAAGAAKHSLTLHASKDDKIKDIERQIAELQAELKKLRG